MTIADITKQIRAFADQLESTQATPSVDPYAEPLTREVELGPEDVPPGSVFRHKDWLPGIHRTYMEINTTGVNWAVNSALGWLELKDSHWQINRSLPLTGKWNPDAWEPCHKEAKP